MCAMQTKTADELFEQVKTKEFVLTKDVYLNPKHKPHQTFADKGDRAKPIFVDHRYLHDKETEREIYVELGELGMIKSYTIDDFAEYFAEKSS
jgi:hypothetical protein